LLAVLDIRRYVIDDVLRLLADEKLT